MLLSLFIDVWMVRDRHFSGCIFCFPSFTVIEKEKDRVRPRKTILLIVYIYLFIYYLCVRARARVSVCVCARARFTPNCSILRCFDRFNQLKDQLEKFPIFSHHADAKVQSARLSQGLAGLSVFVKHDNCFPGLHNNESKTSAG